MSSGKVNLDLKGTRVISDKMLKGSVLSYLSLLFGSGTLFMLLVKMCYRLTTGVCKSTRLMDGKTVLITGANRGIGKATALQLANRKARVILACRDVDKGLEAAQEIVKTTGNVNVSVVQLDLSSFKSVRECAESILSTEERLDVLINNAGIVGEQTGKLTEDGLEEHYAINYFGPFLFTILLLPLLKTSVPSRIINLTSIFHFFGTIDLNDIFGNNHSRGPIGMYSNTKLANILFTRALAKKLKGSGVTVNAVHPGNTETDIAVHCPKWMMFFAPLVKALVVKTVKEGAETSIYASVSEDLEGVSGEYLADCGHSFSSPASKDAHKTEWLWNFSERITGLSAIKRG